MNKRDKMLQNIYNKLEETYSNFDYLYNDTEERIHILNCIDYHPNEFNKYMKDEIKRVDNLLKTLNKLSRLQHAYLTGYNIENVGEDNE